MSNKDHEYKEVFFAMGPFYIYQVSEFSKHGIGALKLYHYIKIILHSLQMQAKGTAKHNNKCLNLLALSFIYFGKTSKPTFFKSVVGLL